MGPRRWLEDILEFGIVQESEGLSQEGVYQSSVKHGEGLVLWMKERMKVSNR